VGADLLLRDARGRVLLVDPSYKPGWDLPGGMSEANEAPVEIARRELKEELGLDTPVGASILVELALVSAAAGAAPAARQRAAAAQASERLSIKARCLGQNATHV
jgi:8-oxo-dGTP pyrophosphatase MutT (NUDIX family)